MSNQTVRTVIIGASGYAGYEAIKRLVRHPHVEITGLCGPENELGPIAGFFPELTGLLEMDQVLFDPSKLAGQADLALLCVPHKVAMSYVPALLEAGLRVIDWSADYRLTDQALYEQWYCEHTDAGNLAKAVYGLPEFYASKIASAELIANPGCYPTCASLALAPLVKEGLIEPTGIVVNAISGVSGAGRKPNLKQHFPERNENFEPYGVGVHRHMPEMEQVISDVSGKPAELVFVPHLCPMTRGMCCTSYATPAGDVSEAKLLELLHAWYDDQPFVRVRDELLPATKYVADTNFCDVTARVAKGRVIAISTIDNLVKGASGQAIQNLNLMFGFDERTALL